MADDRKPPLRRGWTTGACATAAARAACSALVGGDFPDPVEITLPRGRRTSFALARQDRGPDWARAGIIKDAGDDPDVTHGALVLATVRRAPGGAGLVFRAGEGIGTVTRPGLPLAVGEPAINPVPRRMIAEAVSGFAADLEIEIAIPGGEALAQRTMNPRLGILGGLSILGTTGIVVPYSCASWIASIHRGIDVARAAGLDHLAAATGATSEAAVQKLYDLPEQALIDMGDFAGGMLKYLRRHPAPRLTLAGGFAKLAKLAQGEFDLHSARSRVDHAWLAGRLEGLGAGADLLDRVVSANTALEILSLAGPLAGPLASDIAGQARRCAAGIAGDRTALEVLVFDRTGNLLGRSDGFPG